MIESFSKEETFDCVMSAHDQMEVIVYDDGEVIFECRQGGDVAQVCLDASQVDKLIEFIRSGVNE